MRIKSDNVVYSDFLLNQNVWEVLQVVVVSLFGVFLY